METNDSGNVEATKQEAKAMLKFLIASKKAEMMGLETLLACINWHDLAPEQSSALLDMFSSARS